MNMGPDEVANATYNNASMYPYAYRMLVSRTKAKNLQYMDIAKAIVQSNLFGSEKINILEQGPGPDSRLKESISEFRQESPAPSYTFIDRFPKMLPKDRSDNIVLGNATQLPFSTSAFDVVVFSSVLLYISDRSLAAKEAYRVLKPGGILIISELDVNTGANELLKNIFLMEISVLKQNLIKRNLPEYLFRTVFLSSIITRILGLLPSIAISQFVNNKAVNQALGTEGFTQSEIVDLLISVGISLEDIQISRTYANSYHLIWGAKENIE